MLGASAGFPAPDALTATGLMCEALRQAGANVDDHPVSRAEASAASSAYRVELRRLGNIVILSVAFESPVGTTVASRSLQLARLEEIPVAAPRIAESLITGKPLEGTARVNTLVGQETRPYAKKFGEIKAGLGVLGFGIPATDVVGGYGVYGQLYYEALDYAVGADLRVAGSDSQSGDAMMSGISLGARYFFNENDITPFIGAGVGVLWLSFRDDDPPPPDGYYDAYDFEGAGLAAHFDLGVEFLRLHEVRFDVALRVDAPLYELHDEGDSNRSRYALPISIMASYSFE